MLQHDRGGVHFAGTQGRPGRGRANLDTRWIDAAQVCLAAQAAQMKQN
jgi:hypothetical protein